MTVQREEIDLGDGQRAWVEPGLLELRYRGTVQAETARRASAIVERSGASGGVAIAVFVVDITDMDGFSPEARKVFATMPKPEVQSDQKQELHLFIVGATLKTKAVFALVLAAAGLIGTMKFIPHYLDDIEQARSLARAKRDATSSARA